MERSCEFCKFQSVGRMEELAEWLKECKESCAWNCKYSHTKKCNDDENCIEGITKWLKAEVEE